jgi:hypothetical protein
MTRRLSFVAVEGQHDSAFIGRLLKDAGFRLVQRMIEVSGRPNGLFLDPKLSRLVPPGYPHDNDLLARVPVPHFWQSEHHAIALRPANSDSKLANSVVAAIRAIDPEAFGSIAVVLDADNKGVPPERLRGIRRGVEDEARRLNHELGFEFPETPGVVSVGTSKFGVFIMPDNSGPGTLEDLLLECADENYPDLKAKAVAYLSDIDRSALSGDDLDEMEGAPAGEKKAQVGVIASVLKPGKAIQNSISDNRWLEGSAKALPRIEELRRFLRELLDEPSI